LDEELYTRLLKLKESSNIEQNDLINSDNNIKLNYEKNENDPHIYNDQIVNSLLKAKKSISEISKCMEEIDKNHDITTNAGLDLYYDIKTNYEKLRVDTSDFCVKPNSIVYNFRL